MTNMQNLNRILNYIVILCLLFMLGKVFYDNAKENENNSQPKYEFSPDLDDVTFYFPEADSLSLEDVSLYYIYDDEDVVGKMMNTSPHCDKIFGYNGSIPLTIYLDEDDIIEEVVLCDNKESKSYIKKVVNSGLLDEWDGLSLEEAIEEKVDAVSGCTFSSSAIIESMRTRMSVFAEQESSFFAWDRSLLLRQVAILITTVLALICFFRPQKSKSLRIITLVLSICILGFWTNSLLSLALFCNWLINGVSLSIQIPILIVAILSLVLPLVTKKSFYCQYLCPFGALQEFVGHIGSKKIVVSAKVFKFFTFFRKIDLLLLLVLVAFGVGLDLSTVEPFPVFNYQSIGFGVAIFAAVIILLSIFIKKPWCNFLCPTGTLLEVFRNLGRQRKEEK